MEIVLAIFFLGGVAFVIWLVLSGIAHSHVQKDLEQVEVNARNGLAYLLTGEMRGWEAHDPARSHPSQTIEWGIRWTLERRPCAPELAAMLAKAAYVPILRDKIASHIGHHGLDAFYRQFRADTVKYGAMTRAPAGPMDKWWSDVDWEFDSLFEHASECGALSPHAVAKFYGAPPPR